MVLVIFKCMSGETPYIYSWKLDHWMRISKAPPHVSGYSLIHKFFFPASKISPSTFSVFKSNSAVHTHTMISRFSSTQSSEHAPWSARLRQIFLCFLGSSFSTFSTFRLLVSCSVRDWTRFFYVIGFETIWIHIFTRYRIRCGERIKKYPDSPAAEFAKCMWTEAVSGKKKLRIKKFSDTCRRGLYISKAWASDLRGIFINVKFLSG